MFTSHLDTPVGLIEIIANEQAIISIDFLDEKNENIPSLENEISKKGQQQLQEYFYKDRQIFDLPLQVHGTEFQSRVWAALQDIPFAKTISYLQLAKNLGNPKCIRAAGTANGKNPIGIIIPCHRVIGSNGSLVGYAGGLWRKQWLLEHEQKNVQNLLF